MHCRANQLWWMELQILIWLHRDKTKKHPGNSAMWKTGGLAPKVSYLDKIFIYECIYLWICNYFYSGFACTKRTDTNVFCYHRSQWLKASLPWWTSMSPFISEGLAHTKTKFSFIAFPFLGHISVILQGFGLFQRVIMSSLHGESLSPLSGRHLSMSLRLSLWIVTLTPPGLLGYWKSSTYQSVCRISA